MNYDAIGLFTLPTQIHFGYNSIAQAAPEAKRLGIKKPLIVEDEGIRSAGVDAPLKKVLEGGGLPFEIFDDVPMDPGTEKIAKGCDLLKKTGCDGVITLGGGSPICAGKAIALVATNGGNIRDYVGMGKYKKAPLPLIAIPTTAGSGSEVSQVFIITDEKANNKVTIGGYECFPGSAILDPLLLRTLPPGQFIMSGLDALGHAVEATCTGQANFMTDCMAYEAIRIIMENLAPAALTDNLEAKRDQLMASSMANIACGNAKLGLGHAVSSALGTYHVAHGLAVGVLIPYVMEFNLPACEKETAKMAMVIGVAHEDMTQSEMAHAGVEAVKDLYDTLEFPDRLTEDMVPRAKIPDMVKNAMGRPQHKFNLRKSSAEDLTKLFQSAYEGWR